MTWVRAAGGLKPGPSNTYKRMLAGRITSERYAAIVKRWARMSLATHSRPQSTEEDR